METVQTEAGTALSAVQAPAGTSWVNSAATVVGGEQICFAKKDNTVIPVKVVAVQKPVVDVPVIDPSVPVEEVQVGVTPETENELNDIISGNSDAEISTELQQNIDEALARGDQVTISLKSDKLEGNQVPAADAEKITELLTAQTSNSDKTLAVQQYFDFSVLVSANNQVIGEITELNSSKITLQIAIPAELQKEGRTFGVVRGQFPYLDEHIAQKKAIYERYKEGLKDLPVSMNPMDLENSEPNYWLSCLIIDEDAMCKQVRGEQDVCYVKEAGKTCPTEILEAIASINAEGRPIWKPMHMQPIYRLNPFIVRDGNGRARSNAYIAGGVADVGMDIFARGLCLPSDNKMTAEQQDRIIEVIRACFE